MFTTNNGIMVDNFENTRVINCVQKAAQKKALDNAKETEQILLESNKLGFGDEIGKVTNRITGMFDILSKFEPGSKEYETLTYRIIAGQKNAQDTIDRVKGVVCYSMPKYWYQKIKPQDDEELSEEDEFNNRICADRKPYFMIYIYPELMKDYKDFVRICKQGLRRDNSEERKEYYERKRPVNDNGCVMNRLCHMVEKEFEDYKTIIAKKEFDPSILKSNHGYRKDAYNKVYMIYQSYVKEKRLAATKSTLERRTVEDSMNELQTIKDEFIRKCFEVCSCEEELCDIIVDIVYDNKNSKAFAWEMCGDQIIRNLLDKNNHMVKYLTKHPKGEVEYQGERFTAKYIQDDV